MCVCVYIYMEYRTELLNNNLLGILCPGNLLPRPRNLLRANYLEI